MTYELWDLHTGNRLGGYESEAAAYAAVNRIVRSWPDPDLALETRDALGRTKILQGPTLLERAKAAVSARATGRPRPYTALHAAFGTIADKRTGRAYRSAAAAGRYAKHDAKRPTKGKRPTK